MLRSKRQSWKHCLANRKLGKDLSLNTIDATQERVHSALREIKKGSFVCHSLDAGEDGEEGRVLRLDITGLQARVAWTNDESGIETWEMISTLIELIRVESRLEISLAPQEI